MVSKCSKPYIKQVNWYGVDSCLFFSPSIQLVLAILGKTNQIQKTFSLLLVGSPRFTDKWLQAEKQVDSHHCLKGIYIQNTWVAHSLVSPHSHSLEFGLLVPEETIFAQLQLLHEVFVLVSVKKIGLEMNQSLVYFRKLLADNWYPETEWVNKVMCKVQVHYFRVCLFVSFSIYILKLVLIHLGLHLIIGAYFRIWNYLHGVFLQR